jgi:DNA-binding XRE family transcriptional regulator
MNEGPVISERLADLWGGRLAARRKELELTQDQLARIAGITQQTISNTEAGRHVPSDEVKIALARALGYEHVEDLFRFPPIAQLPRRAA